MKAIKAATLFFKHHSWQEFKFLIRECFIHFRDAILSLLFLLLTPIILPYRFIRDFIEFRGLDDEVLNKFFEDPKKWSKKIGRAKRHQL